MDGKKEPLRLKTAILIFLIFALIAALGIMLYVSEKNKPEPDSAQKEVPVILNYGDKDLGIDSKVDEQLKDYQNIALLGIDAKNLDQEKSHRSDAIVIVSLNKKTQDVNLFSVYRDTYLKIDDTHGLDKVNHAYAYGSLDQTLWALNRNLDLNIRQGIALSWEPIAEVIDDMGGISVNIKDSERQYLNRIFDEKNQLKKSGQQTINGEQAVGYSRIRKDSPEGDYRRNERMKVVLAAVLMKAKTLETEELSKMMEKLLSQANSNMTKSRVTDTLVHVAAYNLKDSVGWPYKTDGWMHNSIWYGVPITLEKNVSMLHEKMFDQEGYKPTRFVRKTSQKIAKQSGYKN